jgi:hypothetical protein
MQLVLFLMLAAQTPAAPPKTIPPAHKGVIEHVVNNPVTRTGWRAVKGVARGVRWIYHK